MRSSFSSIMTNLWLSAITSVALAGVILLFPVNLSNEHTCLLDYIVHAVATASDKHAPHAHPSELLGQYLIPYGIFWWSSIIAVITVAVAWSRRRTKSKEPVTDRRKS